MKESAVFLAGGAPLYVFAIWFNPAEELNPMGAIVLLVLAVGALFVYFVPGLVAQHREHKNRAAIIVLNVFLGWTFLGWVLALI